MSKIRLLREHICVQIYGNKFVNIKAYPINDHNKQYVGETLTLMIQETGVLQNLQIDNEPEMVRRKIPFFTRVRKEGINLTTIESLRPDENYGELLVKKFKLLSSKLMIRRNSSL